MGILESIAIIGAAITGVIGIVRELRKGNRMTRGEIIGEAEKLAWHAVEVTKRIYEQTHKRKMSREEIWEAYKKEAWKYASGKGLKAFTRKELEGMRDTAELLSHVAKNGIDMVKQAFK